MNQEAKRTTTPDPAASRRGGKSWAEQRGGLILIGIVVAVLALAVVYESCM